MYIYSVETFELFYFRSFFYYRISAVILVGSETDSSDFSSLERDRASENGHKQLLSGRDLVGHGGLYEDRNGVVHSHPDGRLAGLFTVGGRRMSGGREVPPPPPPPQCSREDRRLLLQSDQLNSGNG